MSKSPVEGMSKKKKRPVKGDAQVKKRLVKGDAQVKKSPKSKLEKAAKEVDRDHLPKKTLNGVKTSPKDAKKQKISQGTEADKIRKAVNLNIKLSVDLSSKTDRKPTKRKRPEEVLMTKTSKKLKVDEKHQNGDSVPEVEKVGSVIEMTRKQRRNRNKKNSKKNKYKHLALNKTPDEAVDGNKKNTPVSHTSPGGVASKKKMPKLKQVPSTKKTLPEEKSSSIEGALQMTSTQHAMPLSKKKKKTDSGLKAKVEVGKKIKVAGYQEMVKSKKKRKTAVVKVQKMVHTEPADGLKRHRDDDSDSDEDSVWSNSADEDFSDSGDTDSDVEDRSRLPVTKHSQDAENNMQSKKGTSSGEKISQTMKQQKSKPLSFTEQTRQKLNSARFRFLNEQLYTSTGRQALEIFKDDPEAFQVYHEGFQAQVARWPVNPLDTIIHQLSKGKAGAVLADFGCGDGHLAESLPKHKVHSFDLVASKPFITACNIARVPLENSSVDVAVFCLSLMGTNLSDYLCEANRVLKQGGTLRVTEVVSRFYSVNNFVKNVEALGFRHQKKDRGAWSIEGVHGFYHEPVQLMD
ncbi:ribosomal RNA-processing protein 8-like isoform X2 [Littorina saxatilis]|uniref:ribosomal RNA-processing protein 8-like isoform X2 n=1 Tax=Littorina saxatilis TaxID=31220 RepID=UPI0038B59807